MPRLDAVVEAVEAVARGVGFDVDGRRAIALDGEGEALLGLLGREGKRLVLLAGHALVVLAYILLCWQALVVAEIAAIELSPALGLPGSYGYWAIAAGCALLALGTVTVAIRIAVLGPEAMPQPSPEEMPT